MKGRNLHIEATVLAILLVGAGVIPLVGGATFEKHTYAIDEPTIELTVDLPVFDFGSVYIGGREFATLELQGEGFTTIVGEARLPMIRHMVEIPYGSNPEVVIESVSWKSASLKELELPERILPVQPSVIKIPGASEEFVIDNEYYANDAFTPSYIAKVVEMGEIRGRRFAFIEFSPVQYKASSGELKLMTACEIRVDLSGSDMVQTSEMIERYSSYAFEKLFSALFENYGYFEHLIPNLLRGEEGYLIIVYDDFYDGILPLANWKQSLGFDTTVTKTSDIPGGPTKENIKAYIEDAYDSWAVPPSYVLLVGDVAQIPTFTGYDSYSAADIYYVTINPEDYFPDIFIGRFPASQEAHVTAMVDKTLTYEQADFPSPDFIKKATFMASTDNYEISEGTHNYVIDNYLDPNNYTCDKLYTYTYGATTQQVRDALNDGRSLAIFSGHGYTYGWGDGPAFDQGDVQGLTNEGMYPFVCSHSCLTGEFDVAECFGETWLREPDKAGLAFWGSSTYTMWDEDDILEKKMFSAWWDDNIGFIGGMTDMALYYLYQHYGGGGFTQYYFEGYNILGDPSVNIWRGGPQVRIGGMSGGLSVSAVIQSVGTENATDIDWSIHVKGGMFGFINKTVSDTIPTLPVGEEVTVSTGIILGFGKVAVTVKAGNVERNATGYVFGILVLGVS